MQLIQQVMLGCHIITMIAVTNVNTDRIKKCGILKKKLIFKGIFLNCFCMKQLFGEKCFISKTDPT